AGPRRAAAGLRAVLRAAQAARVRRRADELAPAGPAGRADRRGQPGPGRDDGTLHPATASGRDHVPRGRARPEPGHAAVRPGHPDGHRAADLHRVTGGGPGQPRGARGVPGGIGMPSLLQLTGVVADYGAGDILKGVDLAVAPGTVTCLIGPNGAGKSTVLKTVSGL